MPNDMTGVLSRDELALLNHATSADLLAFLDAYHANIVINHEDGSGCAIRFCQGAHLALAWAPDGKIRLERRCSTLTYAVSVIRAYEQGLPQP